MLQQASRRRQHAAQAGAAAAPALPHRRVSRMPSSSCCVSAPAAGMMSNQAVEDWPPYREMRRCGQAGGAQPGGGLVGGGGWIEPGLAGSRLGFEECKPNRGRSTVPAMHTGRLQGGSTSPSPLVHWGAPTVCAAGLQPAISAGMPSPRRCRPGCKGEQAQQAGVSQGGMVGSVLCHLTKTYESVHHDHS